MPFKKVGPNRYVSPSGRKFTKKQVAMYYATDGFKDINHHIKRAEKAHRGGKRGK